VEKWRGTPIPGDAQILRRGCNLGNLGAILLVQTKKGQGVPPINFFPIWGLFKCVLKIPPGSQKGKEKMKEQTMGEIAKPTKNFSKKEEKGFGGFFLNPLG